MAFKLKVTLVRSPIGRPQTQKATVHGLGLYRLNQTQTLEDTPSIRGMIQKVRHLVKIESGDSRIHTLRAEIVKRRSSVIHHPRAEPISAEIVARVIQLAKELDAQEDLPPDEDQSDEDRSDEDLYLPAEVHAGAKETGKNSKITIKQHLVPRAHIADFIPDRKKTVHALFLKENRIEDIGPKSVKFCASRLWSHVAESRWSKAIEDLFRYFLNDLPRFIHDPLVQAAISEYWALCRSRIKVYQNNPKAMNSQYSTRLQCALEERDKAEKKGLGLFSTCGDETRVVAAMLICRLIDGDLFDHREGGFRWVIRDTIGSIILPDYWATEIIPVSPTRILVGYKGPEKGYRLAPVPAEEINADLERQGRNFIVSSSKELLLDIQRRRASAS